jgi:hypothetical protein
MARMCTTRIFELQCQCDNWKRLLVAMRDENAYLKTRLPHAFPHHLDNGLLEEVENFQNSFLKEDELISLLRNDVTELHLLLIGEVPEGAHIINQIDKKVTDIEVNIEIAHKAFSRLKNTFNSFLTEKNLA